jgi:hypothetical protein
MTSRTAIFLSRLAVFVVIEQIMNNNGGDLDIPLPAKSGTQISSTGRMRAIPPPFKHIQANGCKTPTCLNFGIPPREGPIQIGRGASADGYATIGAGSEDLACRKCKKTSRLKSNEAIHEEMIRQGDQIWVEPGLRCPNGNCGNSDPPHNGFKKHGTTKSGS